MSEQNDCVMGARHSVEIDNLKNSYIELNAKIDLIFDKLEEMRRDILNRIPIWATMLISLLTGLIGFLGANCIHIKL